MWNADGIVCFIHYLYHHYHNQDIIQIEFLRTWTTRAALPAVVHGDTKSTLARRHSVVHCYRERCSSLMELRVRPATAAATQGEHRPVCTPVHDRVGRLRRLLRPYAMSQRSFMVYVLQLSNVRGTICISLVTSWTRGISDFPTSCSIHHPPIAHASPTTTIPPSHG